MLQTLTNFPGLAAIAWALNEHESRDLNDADAKYVEAEMSRCCEEYPGACDRVGECRESHAQLAGYFPPINYDHRVRCIPDAQRYSTWMPTINLKSLMKGMW